MSIGVTRYDPKKHIDLKLWHRLRPDQPSPEEERRINELHRLLIGEYLKRVQPDQPTAKELELQEEWHRLTGEDPNVLLHEGIREMARKNFGYGRWDARIWFIGPRQGQDKKENGRLDVRLKAWRELDPKQTGLCDCQEFHKFIGFPHTKIQATWGKLLLIMMAFLGRPTDRDSLRAYQNTLLGCLKGETCVIELRGLAANNQEVALDESAFLPEKISIIRKKILQHQPDLVVMYDKGHRQHFEAITEKPFPADGIVTLGKTVVVLIPHPSARGRRPAIGGFGGKPKTNDEWIHLGRTLRHRFNSLT